MKTQVLLADGSSEMVSVGVVKHLSCLEAELGLYRALCAGYTLEELRGMSLTFKSQIEVLRGRAAVPEAMPQTGREKWTFGEWCEHFGGRYKDENPMNYYEFGSMWAISKMLQSYATTQQRIGWNACREALLPAAQEVQP